VTWLSIFLLGQYLWRQDIKKKKYALEESEVDAELKCEGATHVEVTGKV
jgi:hypothetical protein